MIHYHITWEPEINETVLAIEKEILDGTETETLINNYAWEDIVEAYGFIYDDELKIYWHNRELYNKHLQYQNKQKNQTNETRKHDYQDE